MTGKQNAVMWMGLTLILVRLFTTGQWSDIWTGTILKGSKKDAPGFGPGIPGSPGYKPLVPGLPNPPNLPQDPGGRGLLRPFWT